VIGDALALGRICLGPVGLKDGSASLIPQDGKVSPFRAGR
jgi:hypothetical protein